MLLASKQKSVSNKGEKYQKTRTWKWKQDRWGETGELWMNGCRGWMHAVPKIHPRSRAEGGEVRPQNGMPWPCREPWAQYVSFLCPSHTARSPSTLTTQAARGCFSLALNTHSQITMRAEQQPKHKGATCGYSLENVSTALEALNLTTMKGDLKYTFNISTGGVWHKISSYLNFSDSALISSAKEKRK